MEVHLDRGLKIQATPRHKNLYSWAINELDNDGEVLGSDQIPWHWDFYFSATEIVLSDEILVSEAGDIDGAPLEARIANKRIITARLVSGDPRREDGWFDRTTFRMFGTDRAISDIRLNVVPLETERETEICRVLGRVSYTLDSDFRYETVEDWIGFYLKVKPSTFEHYAARISAGTANEVILRVSRVEGFYSAWSPDISTRHVKVLVRGSDHDLHLPDGFEIEPPRLGSVGEVALTINAKYVQTVATSSSDTENKPTDEAQEHAPLLRRETDVSPVGLDPQTLKLLKSLKGAAHWIIGLLVFLVLVTLLKR